MDLDIIVKTNFTHLEQNFVCAESSELIGSALISLDTSATGDFFSELFLEYDNIFKLRNFLIRFLFLGISPNTLMAKSGLLMVPDY